MPWLESPHGAPVALLSRTLVGRAPACDLRLDHRSVSAEHAVIAWSDGAWWLRDLASRNGTTVDGVRVTSGVPVVLRPNQALRFGLDPTPFVVGDVDSPTAVTSLPATVDATLSSATVTLRFRVSSDEEHVAWAIECGPRSIELGDRVHTYLMLTLARARLTDAEALPPHRGWCYADVLARGLGITPEMLKVYVYRARQQLVSAGVVGGADLVERRVATNQIRLATDRIVIDRR
ncbi:MAG: FHA domain-containing protein [Myxococcota bacterium]